MIGHELGHNFGLLHAGSLDCTGALIGCGASGTVAEYGDPFNTMGNSGNTGHFDAAQKDILGWIAPSTVKTHAGGTVTYTLSPIETGGQSTYAVKIPTTNANRTYWIEYRQPVGRVRRLHRAARLSERRRADPHRISVREDLPAATTPKSWT